MTMITQDILKGGNAMDQTTKQNLVRKLTSRKFWLAVVSFVTCVAVFLGGSSETIDRVASLIMAGGTIIAYIIGEGLADSSPTVYEQHYHYTGGEVYDDE